MDGPKRKLTAKVNLASQPPPRSPSPLKVKAKVNSVARKSPATSQARTASPCPTPSPLPGRNSPSIPPGQPNAPHRIKASIRPPPTSSPSSPLPSPSRHRPVFSDELPTYTRERRGSTVSLNRPSLEDASRPKIKSKVSGLVKTLSSGADGGSNTLAIKAPNPLTPQRHRTSSIASSMSHSSVSIPSSTVSLSSPAPPLRQQQSQPPPTPLPLYPITTATPAANPYRFSSVRASPPSSSHHHFQPFAPTSASSDDSNISYGVTIRRRASQVNSSFEPSSNGSFSANSPPTSSLSFSSLSSQEYASSESSSAHLNGPGSQNSTPLSSSPAFTGGTSSDALGLKVSGAVLTKREDPSGIDPKHELEPERKEKVEAKTNRKIADLEITNKSLLAINASLESSKHRQAKEIRELRRKLRESRLILPPRVYREKLKENASDGLLEDEDDDDDDDANEADSDENTPNDDKDGVSNEAGTSRSGMLSSSKHKHDVTYDRVKALLENLLVSAQQALASKPDDFVDKEHNTTKVLHADEIVRWRQGRGYAEEDADEDVDRPESSLAGTSVPRPSEAGEEDYQNGMGGNNQTKTTNVAAPSLSDDEAEVERMVLVHPSSSSADGDSHLTQTSPPPILVTQPS